MFDAGRLDAPESRRVLSSIALHRPWLMAVAAAVLLSALLAYVLTPRMFSATASVTAAAPESDGPGFTMPSVGAAAPDLLKRSLTSPGLIADTADALGLARSSAAGTAVARSDMITGIQDRLSVEASGRPGVLLVRYEDRDRHLAATVPNDLLIRLAAMSLHDEQLRRQLQRSAGPLRAEMDSRQTRLAEAQATVEREAAARAVAERRASALDAQLAAARAAQARADAAAGNAGGSSDRFDSPALRALLAEQQATATRRSELAGRYGALNPELIAAEQQLADVSLRMSIEIRRTTTLVAAANIARARLAAVEAEVAENQSLLATSDPSAGELDQLKRGADAARDRYQAVAEELQRPPTVPPMNLRIVEAAHVPTWPSTPSPGPFAAAGLIAAMLAAAATLLVREWRQRGFRTPRQVESGLGHPVIALVPDLARSTSSRDDLDRARTVDALDSDPDFAAAFRTLAAGLGIDGQSLVPRSVAVCSAVPNEGKTTVSICLARSAATAGYRVVLVDCDGRRRALSRLLVARNEGGLVQLMRGSVPLDSALVRDPSSGIWLIPHSTEEHVEAELFASVPAMKALLAELLQRFDLVVLDTAPVLALEETRLLASLADQVLIVARWRRTPIGATRIARDLLARANAKIAGVALTMVRFA